MNEHEEECPAIVRRILDKVQAAVEKKNQEEKDKLRAELRTAHLRIEELEKELGKAPKAEDDTIPEPKAPETEDRVETLLKRLEGHERRIADIEDTLEAQSHSFHYPPAVEPLTEEEILACQQRPDRNIPDREGHRSIPDYLCPKPKLKFIT